MTEWEQTAYTTISVAARRVSLSPRTVRRYVQWGLVGEMLTEAELAELRRVRRLTDLGVNLWPGWRLSCACAARSRNCRQR